MINYQYLTYIKINSTTKFLTLMLIQFFAYSQSNAQEKLLVELKSIVPNIRYELRYATKNNFTGKRIYPANTDQTYMISEAAEALKNISQVLSKSNLGIVVWDAYRPFNATVKFWNLIHDERYVANPAKGSGHNRGIAIDMSLYDLSNGKLVEMPTGFDNFSDTAHHDFMSLDNEKIKNRLFLKNLMEQYGFQSFQTEWWHYSWPNNKGYEILNIPFRKLKK